MEQEIDNRQDHLIKDLKKTIIIALVIIIVLIILYFVNLKTGWLLGLSDSIINPL